MSAFGKSHRLIVGPSRQLRIIEEPVAIRQTLPDVSVRKQAPVLRLLCHLDCIPRAVLRQARVTARLGAVSDLFLNPDIFNHAFKQPRPRHQDVVTLFFAQLESSLRFPLGIFQISVIEVQIAVVQVHAAQTVMVAILLVNSCCFVQFRQRFLMKLLEAIAMQVLAAVIFGTATGRRFPPPRGIRVNLAAQLQRNQPFDQRKII